MISLGRVMRSTAFAFLIAEPIYSKPPFSFRGYFFSLNSFEGKKSASVIFLMTEPMDFLSQRAQHILLFTGNNIFSWSQKLSLKNIQLEQLVALTSFGN